MDLNQQASLIDLSFYNLFSGVWWMTIEYTVPVESLEVDPLPQHHYQLNWAIPKLMEAFTHNLKTTETKTSRFSPGVGGGGVLPFRCEGYGFQAVYSRIGCINQSVWV